MTEVKNLYSERSNERRRQFNNIINGINMVLMNNIPEVDPSIYDNWQDRSPLGGDCDVIDVANAEDNIKKQATSKNLDYYCQSHEHLTDMTDQCEDYSECEIYQWFAVGGNDADFLKRHHQYVTYSDMLDTYFLAICHLGTGWDYVESMVSDFNDVYFGLDDFSDKEQ